MRILSTLDQINAAVGTSLGTGEWLVIEQERINQFADATGDHQWIHVDAERAAAGPFGATIAHGYLTLSLIPALGNGVFALEHPGPTINYGVNRVRFISPVRVGSRIRAQIDLASANSTPTGVQLLIDYTVEIEGEPKPACVAQTVVLLLGVS
jgi:acyl dehydratase